jgi:hypothetical protein
MDKSQLLNWLHDEHQRWRILLDQIGFERMDQPGPSESWSMKDLTAHLSVWNQRLVDNIRAAHRGDPEPAPPWPAHLQDEDDINAWIYTTYHGRTAREVLAYSEQVFQQLFEAIDGLPADVQVDVVQESHPFYLIRVGEKRFPAGEFFDHLYDDHEEDIRHWLPGSSGSSLSGGRGLHAQD